MTETKEKQKYVIIDIHGLDRFSEHHDKLVGRTITLADGHELLKSLFGIDFVKGWFEMENPPADILLSDNKFFFIGVKLQTEEDNTAENGKLVTV